jgi:hypothetical protein
MEWEAFDARLQACRQREDAMYEARCPAPPRRPRPNFAPYCHCRIFLSPQSAATVEVAGACRCHGSPSGTCGESAASHSPSLPRSAPPLPAGALRAAQAGGGREGKGSAVPLTLADVPPEWQASRHRNQALQDDCAALRASLSSGPPPHAVALEAAKAGVTPPLSVTALNLIKPPSARLLGL